MTISDAMRAFVEEARAVSIDTEVSRRGLKLMRHGSELVGPCPVCGGRDRFSVNLRKGVFMCRQGGVAGDVIALVEYLDATDFLGACETLTGRPPPKGESRGPDPEELARREALRLAAEAERERGERDYREEERARMWRLWTAAAAVTDGSPVDRYLERRRLPLMRGVALKVIDSQPYFEGGSEIWRGPAMIAAIVDGAGTFSGAHLTWIDPVTFGKAEIVDPATGEVLPAKKVRGSMRGGHIPLSKPLAPCRLVIGEGIETVLSVRHAMQHVHGGGYDAATLYWSAVSLGNLGGRASETIPHPTLATTDKLGRRRRVKVPGPIPAEDSDGRPGLMPPEAIDEVIILGDGDSDRFTTEQHLARASARWKRAGRRIRIAFAPSGHDFNDVLRRTA
ncbi:Zinc-binding domain of primase-helicase [Kaistia soli DSM 19436]|uniref:Zinc-binding domain of primase-helicase n=1 Tax=Kaistia soli DSM 19436 TaxID=1122133 RepID=A0A1M4Y8N2_9HYPH|nr:primase-helicase zinc-binding domain-containing protein [Kaistia soli]SHF01822.1 Zinc-binding domain of primase-helicase [Kaistia soli DSM 19436]